MSSQENIPRTPPNAPGWVYGDLVFILEPMFWIGFGIALAMALQTRALRWLLRALPPRTDRVEVPDAGAWVEDAAAGFVVGRLTSHPCHQY